MSLVYRLGRVALLVVGIYFLLNFSSFLNGSFSLPQSQEPLSFALLFIAGTFTGFHCAGMCGSLVIGYTVRSANQGGAKYLTHLYYGAGKTLSYTVIGGIFGALLLFGLSSLRLLPISRDLQFKVPPFLMKHLGGLLRRSSRPFVIGLLNGLMIICGPLQAMYILAAGTGSPVEGAKMLLFFGLGTLPLMMGFGFMASALSAQVAPKLVRVSGFIVIALGIIMLQRGYLMLSTGEDVHAAMGHTSPLSPASSIPPMVHTHIDEGGQAHETPMLEIGKEVEWMVMGKALAQCGDSLSFKEENWTYSLSPDGGSFLLKPQKVGQLHWRCKSGFSEGSFEVVPGASASQKILAIPMAEQIAHLIEKSAVALEGLRHQLHP
jgi:sulfite exporter TauE/SafE